LLKILTVTTVGTALFAIITGFLVGWSAVPVRFAIALICSTVIGAAAALILPPLAQRLSARSPTVAWLGIAGALIAIAVPGSLVAGVVAQVLGLVGPGSFWAVQREGFGITLVMSAAMGLKAFLLIQLTVSAFAGALGIWLFYVQHQFQGAYWVRSEDWNYTAAALQGSSFYKLPRILQWFTGNIGFHHIHHLSPRIPNYHLQLCHEADPFFNTIKPITLLSSLNCLTFRLWDEKRNVFVGFRHLNTHRC